MPVRTLDELSHDARAIVATYLTRVERALPAPVRSHVMEDVIADLLARLSPDDTAETAARTIVELHDPDEFDAETTADARERILSGRLLGVPYDLRRPTANRILERWWNPLDHRVFVPKVFGIGWTINIAAVATRLHLIEPDAEDEVFGSVSPVAFALVALVPLALVLAILLSAWVLGDSLPPQIAWHWDYVGHPGRLKDTQDALRVLLLVGGLPTAWALLATALRRPPRLIGASIAVASFASGIGASVWFLGVFGSSGDLVGWWVPILIAIAPFTCVLAAMLSMARAGRSAEIAHDRARPEEEGNS